MADTRPGALERDGDGAAAVPQPAGAGRGGRGGRRSLFARIRIYYRETVSELRKVIYPTRSELITYTLVVLFFVSFMVAAVFGLDIGLAKIDLLLFGK